MLRKIQRRLGAALVAIFAVSVICLPLHGADAFGVDLLSMLPALNLTRIDSYIHSFLSRHSHKHDSSKRRRAKVSASPKADTDNLVPLPLTPIPEDLVADTNRTSDLGLIAYCSKASLARWDCNGCLKAQPNVTDVRTIDAKGAVGYVALDESAKIVLAAFRPLTPSPNELIGVIRFSKLEYTEASTWWGETHDVGEKNPILIQKGWLRAWRRARQQYLSATQELIDIVGTTRWQDEEWRVLVSGVSYGGPLSILYAVDLAQHVDPDLVSIRVITQGSPRFTNAPFSEYLASFPNIDVYRITIGDDIIPQLPPRSFGYTHQGLEVFRTVGKNKVLTDGVFCDPGKLGVEDTRRCNNAMGGWKMEDHFKYWRDWMTPYDGTGCDAKSDQYEAKQMKLHEPWQTKPAAHKGEVLLAG